MQSYDMRTLFSVLILVSAAGTCFGQANQTCIHTGLVTPVFNFSVDSFLGTWYPYKLYTGLPADAKPLLYRCFEANFSRSDSSFLQIREDERYIMFPNGTDIPSESVDYIHVTEKNPAIWNMVGVVDGEIAEADSVIVQIDYSNWFIQFGCLVRDNYRYETMHIWTRTRTPDPEVMALLEILVNNYGFPPANGRLMEHTNC
ncbi:Crustacyanin-A2 subunit [Orchesella cincta]|uniref:Crustacyanin-A2 subunit n=1 Tax=Orchesella cincta TaxID=48709 RepID=A0A1D2N4H8_ORCCI|nr:Crustacyanin-A2 subunit [Orchesella cincta]